MPTYVLPHSDPREEERLRLMSEMLDPFTRHQLLRAGLAPGFRCLEVGAGNGSVSAWMAEQVGPEGHVDCVDLDTRFLDPLAGPNLAVLQRDVVSEPLEPASYDLVYTRALLHHLPARVEVVQKLAAAVKPGGAVVIQEPDSAVGIAQPPDAWGAIWKGIVEWAATRGIDYHLGRRIPAVMRGAGLRVERAEGHVPMVGGGTDVARYWRLSLEVLREPLVACGQVTEDQLREFYALLDTPLFWGAAASFVAVTGRR